MPLFKRKPTPPLWQPDDWRELLPDTPDGRLAQDNVIVQESKTGRIVATLPTNPAYAAPNVIDQARGIGLDGLAGMFGRLEVARGERAITQRVLAELAKREDALTLREWLDREITRRGGPGKGGGTGKLVDELTHLEGFPAPPEDEKARKRARARLLRSIQRASTGTGKGAKEGKQREEHANITNAEYRARLSALRGSSQERVALAALQRAGRVRIYATGWWKISQDRWFRKLGADPAAGADTDDQRSRAVLAAGGAYFLNECENMAIEQVETLSGLDTVCGLHVEVQP